MRSLDQSNSVRIPREVAPELRRVFDVFSRVAVQEVKERKPRETVVFRFHGPPNDVSLLNALLKLEA